MADKAREWTDKQLIKMEREITRIYQRSAKDLYKKWDAYIGRGNKRIQTLEKDYRDALKVGDEQVIANVEERLKKAKEAFTYRNQYYKDMLDSVTYDMAQVNNDVRAYINGQLPEIYAKNYVQANEIVKDMKLDFALPNENAIKNRILEGDVKTPFMRTDNKNFIKIPKDQRWNTKYINSQVMQGIIQGEDMRTISKRIFPEMWAKADKKGLTEKEKKGLLEKNKQAAIRNARTLVTGAENQGKHDSYKDLAKRGIVLKQVWIATGDARTRDWHLVMDGQQRDIDEKFEDGIGNKLRYPGDPQAAAETVYNCRCALTTEVIGFRNADGTIRKIDEVDEGQDLHDKQILAEIEKRKIEIPKVPVTKEKEFNFDFKVENPVHFSNAKEATEYFRGSVYESKLGKTGYGIREDESKSATKWKNKLTYNQEVCITGYTGDDYEPINNYLRGLVSKEEAQDDLSIGDIKSIDKRIKHMDDGIKKFNLEEPITVYRTCEREFLDQLTEGGMFHDEGYGSTSVLPLPVASGDVFMEIDVPSGKGIGAYVDAVSWKEGEEYEFLLGRGANYYIESITERKDGIHVKATIANFTK